MRQLIIFLFTFGSLGYVHAQKYTNLVSNSETLTITSDSLETLHVLENSPSLLNGILEFEMTPLNSKGHIGAVIRYQSPESWVYLGCDMSADLFGRAVWYITTPKGTKPFVKDINKPFEGLTRKIRIKYVEDIITLWVEGEEVGHKTLPPLAEDNNAGKVGFRAWNGGAMQVNNIRYTPAYTLEATSTSNEKINISSATMAVEMDRSFPRVLEYTWSKTGNKLYGEHEAYNYITINGYDHQPIVAVTNTSNNTIDYRLKVPELEITVDLRFTVEENALALKMTSIKEEGEIKVKTIGFPRNSLVSVKHAQSGSAFSVSKYVADFTGKDVFRMNVSYKDFFYKLRDKKVDRLYHPGGIVILNTDELAATIDNNVMRNLGQFRYQTREFSGEKSTGIWNSDWVYRGLDNKITELPWAKIWVAPDMNADNEVNWQDGAIALRENISELDGAEKLRNSFFHLDMTSGSRTNYTFLRWLDLLKKVNLYTDGFGQIFQIKGYQSEGHDSAHPDYGNNFNQRAGGLDDLRTLFRGAQRYNADICLHINHSESYPEAKSFDPEIVSDIPAWEWWDQSYFIKREPDILNGTFKKRLRQLRDTLPELNIVYMDTYREERWIADYTAKLLQEMGWAIYTEDSDTWDRFASWVHYAPGGESKISRFVHHHHKDGYKADPLLLGGYESRNYRVSDITKLMYSFMTHQLPYRYLMHFPVMQWTEKEALFAGNVKSMVVDGKTVVTKDNKAILRDRDIFIPWNPAEETKIYYYNTSGSNNTWELPGSWDAQTSVAVYELTDLGRKFVKMVEVNTGKVTLDLKNKTPYVLYKRRSAPVYKVEWGEGSLVKDMGFDSKGFAHWEKDKKSKKRNAIAIKTSGSGNAYLNVEGKSGNEAYITQKITGLEGGKTYAASVWAEVGAGRKAIISVAGYGGPEVSNYLQIEGIKNTISSQKSGNYQRMRVLFTMPKDQTEATLYLKASSGSEKSFVHFDDVRVIPFYGITTAEHHFYEDFENIDEGIYPFIMASTSSRVHLSEKNEGYTKDVLSGNFSLKISSSNPNGLMAQTLPSSLRFQPNKTHTISFDYQVDQPEAYSIKVKSITGGDETVLVDEFLNKTGKFKRTFTTSDKQDYSIFLYKHDSKGDSELIIDELTVD